AKTWKQGSARVTARLWQRAPGAPDSALEPLEMADATVTVTTDVPPGQEAALSIPITFSRADGVTLPPSQAADAYELRWEVADGSGGGSTDGEPLAIAEADIGAVFTHDLTPDQLPGDRRVPVKLGLR